MLANREVTSGEHIWPERHSGGQGFEPTHWAPRCFPYPIGELLECIRFPRLPKARGERQAQDGADCSEEYSRGRHEPVSRRTAALERLA